MSQAITQRWPAVFHAGILLALSACSAWVNPDPTRALVPIDAGPDGRPVFDLGSIDLDVSEDASLEADMSTPRDSGLGTDAATSDSGRADGGGEGGTDGGRPIGLPDTCADAHEIVLTNGMGSVRGTFGDFRFDYPLIPSCVPPESTRGGNGRDAVYFINVNNVVDVTLETAGSDASVDPVLSVGEPNVACRTFGLACHDDLSTAPRIDRQSRIWLHRVGTPRMTTRVYILVSGYNASTSGTFVLNARVTEPAAQDTCPVGSAAPLDVTNGGLLVGFARLGSGSGMTTSSRCARGVSAPEALVSFLPFTDAPGSTIQFTANGRDFVPILYARTSCADIGSEISCQPSGTGIPSNPVSLAVSPIAPSVRRFLFIDNLPNRDTTFTVRVAPQ